MKLILHQYSHLDATVHFPSSILRRLLHVVLLHWNGKCSKVGTCSTLQLQPLPFSRFLDTRAYPIFDLIVGLCRCIFSFYPAVNIKHTELTVKRLRTTNWSKNPSWDTYALYICTDENIQTWWLKPKQCWHIPNVLNRKG